MISAIPQHKACLAGALLVIFLSITPNAAAKHGQEKADRESTPVIAHLALPGSPVTGMFLQEQDGRQYLYLEEASGAGVSILDVTKPDRPDVIRHVAWPANAASGRLQMVAGLALVRSSGGEPAKTDSSLSTDFVSVLDLRDPANPRAVHNFMGVTSVVADELRSLIYITNSEGLWILKHKQTQSAAPEELCSSESAIAGDLQNCY
jgi:hypothetical protein